MSLAYPGTDQARAGFEQSQGVMRQHLRCLGMMRRCSHIFVMRLRQNVPETWPGGQAERQPSNEKPIQGKELPSPAALRA
ncbi:hypothetical protein ADZ37_07800 [Pannonibacter phragmitetus]|uniref:hypothetical protein n=1 Tax=Pannonibacter phragmitetus TaxID=121719 RepID=UPI00067C1A40|nr:hypothetical protein [Pannonibacter phragmitetus]KND19606.1 hypothetical protein ADZ37_07800 [Pannonibacter phragmitetus]